MKTVVALGILFSLINPNTYLKTASHIWGVIGRSVIGICDRLRDIVIQDNNFTIE